MNFVRKKIEDRVEFLMKQIEDLSSQIEDDNDSIIKSSLADLKNKEIIKKVTPYYFELSLYMSMLPK